MVTALFDWKKENAHLGVDYRLQVGGYWGAPLCYDKGTQQIRSKPVADLAIVAWVGPHGVQPKLVLDRAQLEAAFQTFQHALLLYRFLREHDKFVAEEEQRYPHPEKPGETLVSVTQVLKHIMGKPGLLNWYYEGGLEAGLRVAGALPPETTRLALETKLKLNEKTLTRQDDAAQPWKDVLEVVQSKALSPTAKRDAAGTTGSLIHKNVMFYLRGTAVELTQAPPWLRDTMTAFAMWDKQVQLKPVMVEQMVYHPSLEYAGTLDAIVELDEVALRNGQGGRHGA